MKYLLIYVEDNVYIYLDNNGLTRVDKNINYDDYLIFYFSSDNNKSELYYKEYLLKLFYSDDDINIVISNLKSLFPFEFTYEIKNLGWVNIKNEENIWLLDYQI